MESVCIAFKAHQGWVNAVAVRQGAGQPEPVYAARIDLVDPADREALEPYHVAGGWQGLTRHPQPPDPQSIIRRGRGKQAAASRRRLSTLQETLAGHGLAWRRAVVLTARGRLGDLAHVLASHAQIHVAEGEAVRDAIRAALTHLGIEHVDLDARRVLTEAASRLEVTDADASLKHARPTGAWRWTKEERLSALAAWLGADR